MFVWPLHLLYMPQRKTEPTVNNVWRQITTVLKDKKGRNRLWFSIFLTCQPFASRNTGKHKQESINATRWCLFTKTYINRFSGVFSTKIQRANTLKVEYAIGMKFLSGKWIWGLKIRVNLLKFTTGRQVAGFTFSTACGWRAEHVQ